MPIYMLNAMQIVRCFCLFMLWISFFSQFFTFAEIANAETSCSSSMSSLRIFNTLATEWKTSNSRHHKTLRCIKCIAYVHHRQSIQRNAVFRSKCIHFYIVWIFEPNIDFKNHNNIKNMEYVFFVCSILRCEMAHFFWYSFYRSSAHLIL